MGQHILVCSAHIHWDPEFCDVKLTQTMMLMERLREILHEQGREIDQLRQENQIQEKRIQELETALEEEMQRRQGDLESMTVKIETEVQERIFYDRRINTVVNDDRDANHAALSCLREDFMRENEMLRS